MRSKFSANIIGPIVCFFLLVFGVIFCTIVFCLAGISIFYAFFVDLMPCAVLAWLVCGEFRTKMIVVELGDESMIIKPYGGLGTPRKIYYSDLDGYSISVLDSINMAYEYLYLVQRGRKIGKLSEYYHENYAAMKTMLEPKLKNLGFIEFRYWDEIREAFS